MHALPLRLAALLLCVFSVGCASRHDPADVVFIYLKSGPTSGQGDPEPRKAMFAGHMANMRRLADEQRLVLAGPFAKPTDPTWRGVQIFDTPSPDTARQWAASDPGIIAGEFIADAHALHATPTLRRILQFERELQASQKDQPPPAPGAPPRTIRAYVMITAEEFARAARALQGSPWKDQVLWSGAFTGTPRGVFVLDAADPAPVRAALTDAGPCAIDGWWATTSLLRLREP